MHPTESSPDAEATPASGLLTELAGLGRGLAALFSAQLDLLAAEFGLARAAVGRMLMAAVAGGVFALYLGLTLFALLAVVLALWLDSWIWSLAIVAAVQAALIGVMVLAIVRCRRYLGFPATRAQWSAMMRETRARAEREVQAEDSA